MSVEKLDILEIIQEHKPFVANLSFVVQRVRDTEALGVWVYLSSLPPNWRVNKLHIMQHFRIGDNKYNRIFSYLERSKLIIRKKIRSENGRFVKIIIQVLSGSRFVPEEQCKFNGQEDSTKSCATTCSDVDQEKYSTNENFNKNNPQLENHGDGYHLMENAPLINTIIKNTTVNTKTICAPDEAQVLEPDRFQEFYELYPKKKNPSRARRIWDKKKLNAKASEIISDLRYRVMHCKQWMVKNNQYIPHPDKYLTDERWLDDRGEEEIQRKENDKSSNSSFSDFMMQFRKR